MTDPNIIGFVPIYKPALGTVRTAALIICSRIECGQIISAMGGPGPRGVLCVECTEKLFKAGKRPYGWQKAMAKLEALVDPNYYPELLPLLKHLKETK